MSRLRSLATLAFAAATSVVACVGGDAVESMPPSSGGGGAPPCPPGVECEAGETCCGEECFDLETDLEHCGGCDVACPFSPNTTPECVAGVCEGECVPGFGDCNLLAEDGCEVNLQANPTSCGVCGTVCLFANALPACVSGACAIASCKPGFDDCNGEPADGCEASLGTDTNHCGACGSVCGAPYNALPSCVAGACAAAGCKPGFGDCDGVGSNGCETDLDNDVTSCGTCGNACPGLPHALAGCTGGICSVGQCAGGWADCDNSVWSGCETELATSASHCGACNTACPLVANGVAACEGGACLIGGCNPGFADCNALASDGCETNLAADPAHCGICGNACPAMPHAQAGCAGFSCTIATCDAGFADCYGGMADGCETDLSTDPAHCGTCATACPVVADGQNACVAGGCVIGACTPDRADCNLVLADGCETDLETSIAHCGGCNSPCPNLPNSTASCKNGGCFLGACNYGYGDCDGNPANGCEFGTLSDASNCGACGIKCLSGICAAGACVCQKTVLLVADDSPSGSATLAAALGSAGFSVTQTAVPSYLYTGDNPSPAGFGAIVVLTGGPGQTSFSTDMPAGGQQAIASHVGAGGGLVLTEWSAYQVAQGRWPTLAPLVLLTRTAAYTGQVTYVVDPAFAQHPLWAGLPASFTFASTSNVGSAKIAPGVTRVAGSAQAVDGVAILDGKQGRVVHLAHAGNYAPNGWTNPLVQKLVANAVGWSARCQ